MTDKKYLTQTNEAVFLDVLKDQESVKAIAAKHGIRADKVRQASFRFARGLYDWAWFSDRLDLLRRGIGGEELSPWDTIPGYRVDYRKWLTLYRAWKASEEQQAEG